MKSVVCRSLLVTTALLGFAAQALAADATYDSSENLYLRGNTDNSPGQWVYITTNGSSTTPDTADAGIALRGSTPHSAGSGSVDVYGATTIHGATTITGDTTIVGSTNMITGATWINTSGAASTTIGGIGNLTALNSSTIDIGTGAYATTVTVGSTSATTVNATAGTSNMNLAVTGQTGAVVDARGAIGSGAVAGNTASLTTTNVTSGLVNGIVAQQTQTVVSGGSARGTSMTLNDSGATFSNAATGGPVRVTGVADGVAAFDAVNVRQLRSAFAGVAGAAAMANIPAVDPGKRFGLGIAMGGFKGQNAVAVGAGLRVSDNLQVKASASTSANNDTGGRNTAYAIGAGLSF